MNTKGDIFVKSSLSLLFVIAAGFYLIFRAEKPKSQFMKAEGIVISLSKTSPAFPGKDTSKFRYLQIDNYPKLIELFIGKSAGDFKPKLEKVDALKPGDAVTIYYDENFKTRNDPVNRLVYFIDRGQEAIFIKGSWEKYLGYFIILVAFVIFFILYRAKLKGKIT
jgi:hypothetical protein